MRAVKHRADQMTPLERAEAIAAGRDCDRVPCVPFMGELKCSLAGITVWDFWHDPQKMADTEVIAFNRYGYDRITIGPNTEAFYTPKMGQAIMNRLLKAAGHKIISVQEEKEKC